VSDDDEDSPMGSDNDGGAKAAYDVSELVSVDAEVTRLYREVRLRSTGHRAVPVFVPWSFARICARNFVALGDRPSKAGPSTPPQPLVTSGFLVGDPQPPVHLRVSLYVFPVMSDAVAMASRAMYAGYVSDAVPRVYAVAAEEMLDASLDEAGMPQGTACVAIIEQSTNHFGAPSEALACDAAFQAQLRAAVVAAAAVDGVPGVVTADGSAPMLSAMDWSHPAASAEVDHTVARLLLSTATSSRLPEEEPRLHCAVCANSLRSDEGGADCTGGHLLCSECWGECANGKCALCRRPRLTA
jgi:hypothetical protein